MTKYADLILTGTGGVCLITAVGLLAGWVVALAVTGVAMIATGVVMPKWD